MSSSPSSKGHPPATGSAQGAGSRQPTRRKQRHPRKPTSCESCRASKLRCDRELPCGVCKRRGTAQSCRYTNHGGDRSPTRPRQAASHARPLVQAATTTSQQPLSSGNISARVETVDLDRENQDFTRSSWESLWQRPAQQHKMSTGQPSYSFSSRHSAGSEDLVAILPPSEYCDFLAIQYFTYIAPMFHILHEASFQKQYNSFSQGLKADNLSWLAILFSIFSLAVQTLEANDPVLAKLKERIPCPGDNAAVASKLRQIAMACLERDNFMFNYNLDTLESLLVLTYGISHDNGVDAAWTFLGVSLNMGIALKCNTSFNDAHSANVESERRRRCWAGILSLHTYQTILFRDIDTRSLMSGVPGRELPENPFTPTDSSAGAQVMSFKTRMFRLSSRICHNSLNHAKLDEETIVSLDAEIYRERQILDAAYLKDGSPSVLDTPSYAHWCMLQVYIHQLYLLLHRPFSRDKATGEAKAGPNQYRQASRRHCITSGAALLDLQRGYVDVPRLRQYRWTVYGMIGSCAVHGAMALASCLLEKSEDEMDVTAYHRSFDAAVDLIGTLQCHSTIYVKAYPILRHIQSILGSRQQSVNPNTLASENMDFGESFDNWMDTIQWFDPQSINWGFWEEIVGGGNDQSLNQGQSEPVHMA